MEEINGVLGERERWLPWFWVKYSGKGPPLDLGGKSLIASTPSSPLIGIIQDQHSIPTGTLTYLLCLLINLLEGQVCL